VPSGSLDREANARSIIDRAMARSFDSSDLHFYLYDLAFLKGDAAGMERQMSWAAGEPAIADLFLGHAADTLAFSGQVAQAREFTGRAVEAALRAGEKETAAGYEVEAAQREAFFVNSANADHAAEQALALAHDRDTRYGVALALALAGSFDRANAIAVQLKKDFPDDTLVQFVYVPPVLGALTIGRKHPDDAIQALHAAAPYELGVVAGLVPAYLRGRAHLDAGDGQSAASEFNKILAHPGVLLNSPIAPLARLQLARAYRLQRRTNEARTSYQDFLNRWKQADPDLPVLRAAKAEYIEIEAPPTR